MSRSQDTYLTTALTMQAMACEIMHERKEPWNARAILDGALSVLKFSQAPERAEVEVAIKADLATCLFKNPTYVNAFLEQGAASLFERTLDQALAVLGQGHRTTAYVLSQRASMYMAQCRYAEAERDHKRAIEILDAGNCPDPALLASLLVEHAQLLRKTGRADAAWEFEVKAENVSRRL